MHDHSTPAARVRGSAIPLAIASLLLTAFPALAGEVPGTDCPVFPANSWWSADVSQLPVHKKSKKWLSNMSPKLNLHPDFGPSFGEQKVPYGIPITVVGGDHKKVKVKFKYASESDRERYPLGKDTQVEGGQYKSGDRHTVVVDRDDCRLYETWATRFKDGKWSAGGGAIFDLNSNELRPDGWTSADAAGLPILPGLLRYEEAQDGTIDHAVRFTTDVTDDTYLWPARHAAGSVNNSNYPPMGARFRLKAGYAIDPGLRADTRAVLEAFKKYGLVLADNGSPWYFQGTTDKRWSGGIIEELKEVPADAFEAVDTSSLMVDPNSMEVDPN
jgi:hypothetical protein